jgi:hypothetical protein
MSLEEQFKRKYDEHICQRKKSSKLTNSLMAKELWGLCPECYYFFPLDGIKLFMLRRRQSG